MTLKEYLKYNGNQECYACVLQEDLNNFLKGKVELTSDEKFLFENRVERGFDTMMGDLEFEIMHEAYHEIITRRENDSEKSNQNTEDS